MMSLHRASGHGRIKDARTLLAAGADVDALNWRDETPLVLAAMSGHTEVASVLLAAGARVDAPLRVTVATPLARAASRRHIGVACVLLEAGANPNGFAMVDYQSPLCDAAGTGHEGVRRTRWHDCMRVSHGGCPVASGGGARRAVMGITMAVRPAPHERDSSRFSGIASTHRVNTHRHGTPRSLWGPSQRPCRTKVAGQRGNMDNSDDVARHGLVEDDFLRPRDLRAPWDNHP